MKVSVVMPLYNAEKYVRCAIESVLNQTWKNIELIIVDDGSDDKSYFIAKEFESDKRVKVVKQSHKGGCVARNKALEFVQGDYIQFLDADDLLEKNKIEIQLMSLLDEDVDVLALGDCWRIDEEGNILKPSPMNRLCTSYTPAIDALISIWESGFNSFPYSSYLIPKQLIFKAGKWNEKLARSQDSEYMARVISVASSIKYIPNSVFYYRMVNNSVSLSKLDSKKIWSEIEVCKLVSTIILNHSLDLRAVIACEFHCTAILTSFFPVNKLYVDDLLKHMKNYKLSLNFSNRGKFFRVLNGLFGWQYAVLLNKRITKMKFFLKLK